ncbi:MAG TPA: trehalose-6-phosphate synthase [Candidatus Acidoferrales bacterium]|nr:trehalose-6-phosphate synthase [Candidatus Acidoferrales bacterium]
MVQTRDTLRDLIRRTLKGRQFVVVSNREPYIHTHADRRIEVQRPASGLTVALDPVMRAAAGLWVAHGSGDADRRVTDEHGRIRVPPEKPSYTLKRVWLSKEQEEGYYYGFANSALWPLCHIAYRRPVFRQQDWKAYREVNELFAEAVAEEIGNERAFVFVQDYHLALLPRMLKERCPRATVGLFWHIPWPNPEVFRICPWKHELLEGLLGSDILGFHIRYHVNNFIDTVDRELEARPDREMTAIVYQRHTTKIRNFPISVDFKAISQAAASRAVTQRVRQLRELYRLPRHVGIGIDRADYTKGIPERLRAVERFLELHPEHAGDFVFMQVAVPSRVHVEEYRRLNEEIDALVEDINWKHGSSSWKPILYLKEHWLPRDLHALYRLARFCLVSSLHDGMNLVSKEFVAANVEEDGVLLLSQFTGAARELRDAVIINPYATDELAEKINDALEMDSSAVRLRMRRLRETVREKNIYKWAHDIIRKLGRLP